MTRNYLSTSVFFVFAMVTLLSCCSPVSSFFYPRVTRTRDAIIIDYAGVGYSPIHPNLGDIGQESSFNPYLMMYQQQQQPTFSKEWSDSLGYPSPIKPTAAQSRKQFAEDVERQVAKQGTTTTTTTQATTTTTPATTTTTTKATTTTAAPAPAIQCGRGPMTFPKAPVPVNAGRRRRSLISERLAGDNAVDSAKNAWPFMVLVLSWTSGGLPCVGSMISDTKVLLAAQCFEQMPLAFPWYYIVSIGVQSISLSGIKAQMTRRISKVVLHSHFNALTFENDIAIITLDAPVPFSRNVAPVCLPPASADPDQYVDQDAMILGWGFPSGNPTLQQGVVSIMSNDECRAMEIIGQYVSNTTTCVSSDKVFTCTQDIGGPVVVMSSPGVWTVVGINSYTNEACDSNGLKTRVSAFRSWIDQYIQN